MVRLLGSEQRARSHPAQRLEAELAGDLELPPAPGRFPQLSDGHLADCRQTLPNRLYEGGPGVKGLLAFGSLGGVCVKRCGWASGPAGRSGRWSGAHFSIALIDFEDWVLSEPLRWRNSKMGCQAARRKVAPAGAKGWLRVSVYQIAWASWRARSIWATLAPRWRPWRRRSRWWRSL